MYDVNIIICAVSANPTNREQYILSSRNDSILFPSFKPTDCSNLIDNIHTYLSTCFTNYIKSPNLFLIDINSNNINALFNSNNTLNIVYGTILPPLLPDDKYAWKTFSFKDLSIPNELVIIGEVIQRAF